MDKLIIGMRQFDSRLLVGTGKYRDFAQTRAAIDASGAQIVPGAIRRTNIGQTPGGRRLLQYLRARELLDGHALVKREVLGDQQSLFPNVRETLNAAETLVKDGFEVMVYTS